MANIKITDLTESLQIGDDDYLYAVVDGASYKIKKGILNPIEEAVVGAEIVEPETENSITGLQASPIITSDATTVLNINLNYINQFFVGQRLKIYGASIDEDLILDVPTFQEVQAIGFENPTATTSVSYRLVQFSLVNGKISPQSNASSSFDVDFSMFNKNNYVTMNISRSSVDYGVLVYRSQDGGSIFNLIDILGPKQLGGSTVNITYVDYGAFNYVSWSNKISESNIYNAATGLIHLPLNPSVAARKGWVYATVAAIDDVANTITLNSSFYFDTTIYIEHDDTAKLQAEINARIDADYNYLVLKDRSYNVSELVIPSDFSIIGRGRNSILRKLSWSATSDNNIIRGPSENGKNISLRNFDIDGNQVNQVLKAEPILGTNYAVYAPECQSLSIDQVNIDNIVGGGIWAIRPSKLMLNFSRIENSGMSDFYAYSPLASDNGNDIMVTNNVFQNFTSAIDLSLSNDGIFSNNIVKNTGTGVLTFASKFLISNPNIISGPAGEYIPGPDSLNSEYDSVNINLDLGSDFDLSFKYQENGNDFDLTANRADDIEYSVYKLRQVNNVEELYETVLIGGLSPIQGVSDINLDPTIGEFKFRITSASVTELVTGEFSYSTSLVTEPNHIGLVYQATLTEYVPSGTIIGSGTIGTPSANQYSVTVSDFTNLAIGTQVRMLNHGGSPDLDSEIGTVINIVTLSNTEASVTVEYDTPVVTQGIDGDITVMNSFILAKGRIQ